LEARKISRIQANTTVLSTFYSENYGEFFKPKKCLEGCRHFKYFLNNPFSGVLFSEKPERHVMLKGTVVLSERGI